MEPKKEVDSFVFINKPNFIVNRISCSLKIDKSYKMLQYADSKLCESESDSNQEHNLQYAPGSDAEVPEVYENICYHSEIFATEGDDDVSFQLYMYVIKDTNSSGQRRADVFLDLVKPDVVSVLLYAAVRPTSTGPFVEKPDNVQFWKPACPLKEVNRFELECAGLETGEEDLWLTVDVTYAKVMQECQVIIMPPTTKRNSVTEPKSSFLSPFACLLDNPMNSDVTLRANDREWPVHKCILSARSPVFAAMFNGKLMESIASSVEIKDVDSSALDLMIKYIYTSKLHDMENLGVELLCLADRYDLPDLKRECEVKLVNNLNLENCLAVLLAGIKFNAESVVEEAKSSISANLSHVCTTKEWRQFAKENADLSVDLTIAYSRTVNSE